MNLRFYIADKNNRPIIDYNAIIILFDTGASTPVWCMGKKRFYGFFPDATKQRYKYLLSGFGRTEQELKDFILHPDKNKVDDFLTMTKLNDVLKRKNDDEKKATKIIWIFAILGIIAAIGAAAYGIYRFFTPDYLDDFEDDLEDEFEDDFFDDDEEEASDK